MANETTLTLVGNLTDDPELRYTPTGVALAKFTVAATPRQYDRDAGAWKDGDALFMNCSAWRDLGVNIAESLSKGARVVVTGRLRLNRWETPEGEKRSAMQLDVEDIGASLKYAQAKVMKMARKSDVASAGGEGYAGDPWATTSGKASQPQDDEPPF